MSLLLEHSRGTEIRPSWVLKYRSLICRESAVINFHQFSFLNVLNKNQSKCNYNNYQINYKKKKKKKEFRVVVIENCDTAALFLPF